MAVLVVVVTELVDMADDVVADVVVDDDDGPLDPTMRAYSCDMADCGNADLSLTSAVCTVVAD